MRFFPRSDEMWVFERGRLGQYRNSPTVWRECGVVYASSRREALDKALVAVGGGLVRVRPVDSAREGAR